jgi:hypothetical protein
MKFGTGSCQVLFRYLTGIEDLQKGDAMTFFWKSRCRFSELEEGKAYMIIGKDGHKFYDGESEE